MFQASYTVDKLFNSTVSWYINRLVFLSDSATFPFMLQLEIISRGLEIYLCTCIANRGKYHIYNIKLIYNIFGGLFALLLFK